MPKFHYITDFWKSRKGRIGASDIPKMIPHPDKPGESLAGYGNTAITLYEEKIGIKEKDPGNLATRQGHREEPGILWEFINEFANEKTANLFYRGYMLCELERTQNKNLDCKSFNTATKFKHHTEAINDFGVSHADCIYIPKGKNPEKIKKFGIIIDPAKSFIIEAKSARFWSAKRKNDRYKGYDFDMKGWQGIPLANYMQIQYQMALYEINTAYLVLIHNTSEIAYWQIKANKKWQGDLFELASDMKRCIDKRQYPKHLSMNVSDIRKLYPEIKEDFKIISGSELDKAIETVKKYNNAKEQAEEWKKIANECKSSLAVFLKDSQVIKGMIDGEIVDLVKWRNTGGGEKIKSLKEIKENHERIYKYLIKNEMVEERKRDQVPSVCYKEEI